MNGLTPSCVIFFSPSVVVAYFFFLSKNCVYLRGRQAGFWITQQIWLEAWIGLILCALGLSFPISKMVLVVFQQ